jgi:hypothetical protein
MITVKEVLLDQLAACHDDESWFKPSKTILDDLSADEAIWKAADHRHSIWSLAVTNCEHSKLEKSIPSYDVDAQWWGVISNLCIHNAYHIGQMMLLKLEVKEKI